MLERLRICLLHPKFIGKFIVEKMWKIWLIYAIFALLMATIIFVMTYPSIYLTQQETNQIVNVLAKDENINLEYVNNTLKGNSQSFRFNISGMTMDVEFLKEDSIGDASIELVFLENSCKAYLGGQLIGEKSYTSLTIGNFIFTALDSSSSLQLGTLIASCFDLYKMTIALWNSLIITFENLGILFLVLLVTFLLTYGLNQGITGKYRFNLLIHCGLPCLMFYLLSYLFNVAFLQYVGFIFPLIYMSLALKSIVKLETHK